MFKHARIKLTAYYLLVIMFVTLSFSTIVYTSTTSHIQRGLEMQEKRIRNKIPPTPGFPKEPFLDNQIVSEIKRDTLITLLLINILILVVIGVPGYWLAGKTLKPIEEITDKQKRFIADAAHELKTPLTSLKTNIEVNLRNKNMGIKNARIVLEDTLKDVDYLNLLTNSLIKQSKYQNKSDLEKKGFEIKKTIGEIITRLTPKMKEKNIKVSITGEKLEIKANKESITELFTILIDNAIKFNKDSGKIEVTVKKINDRVVIVFKDTGEGINNEDLSKIFDRFYKTDASRSKNQVSGFGLGLSIAKEIVEAHDGNITVSSKKDEGSEFVINLPISQ